MKFTTVRQTLQYREWIEIGQGHGKDLRCKRKLHWFLPQKFVVKRVSLHYVSVSN